MGAAIAYRFEKGGAAAVAISNGLKQLRLSADQDVAS